MTDKERQKSNIVSESDTLKRRDEAVRRALNTPPKPHKDMKKGKKKRQDDHLTASGAKRG